MNMQPGLSVLILTRNEEHNIVACLNSVQWAEERIVVDSGSTDRTVELATPLATRVLAIPWRGFGKTKNEALIHTHCEWVLWLDADERVSEALGDEIRRTIGLRTGTHSAYDVARRAFFLGKWIRHCGWYPSRVTRLFRQSAGAFSESAVHEYLIIDGTIGHLGNDLYHYTDPDLHHYFAKFNRYTSLAAEELHATGRKAGLADLLFRPGFMFIKMFVMRRGFLDGIHGFILSVVSSAYVFTKYAKLWERTKSITGTHAGS
ncbi:MAG: glycosyltransferase family 2 protein [Ignavibacteria bacterium]|nr:glycosyltransferase family 2 protein [Ignavibacteria bacterium]